MLSFCLVHESHFLCVEQIVFCIAAACQMPCSRGCMQQRSNYRLFEIGYQLSKQLFRGIWGRSVFTVHRLPFTVRTVPKRPKCGHKAASKCAQQLANKLNSATQGGRVDRGPPDSGQWATKATNRPSARQQEAKWQMKLQNKDEKSAKK